MHSGMSSAQAKRTNAGMCECCPTSFIKSQGLKKDTLSSYLITKLTKKRLFATMMLLSSYYFLFENRKTIYAAYSSI